MLDDLLQSSVAMGSISEQQNKENENKK